jgi:succinate dehydrogenase / fumarate reductase cytochrome b subunit
MQAESTLKLTLREAIRYRGLWGQWSWIAHRLSGLVFKWFPFSVMEIGLMAAVLYHAVNGIRITLLDFKPEWWKYQRQSAIAVWGLFFVVFIPIAFFMFSRTLNHCSELSAAGASCFSFPTP